MALHNPKCLCMTPNSPKTLPMGILHGIVSCWTTLGPFQRPTGPQYDPKKHQNGPLLPKIALYCPKWPFTTLNNTSMKSLHDPKCPFMTQNVPAWPEMTLKHFSGAEYMIILHIRPPWGLFRGLHGPSGPLQRPKCGPAWHNIIY